MGVNNYDDVTIGTVLSEKDLQYRNHYIYNNSLIAIPTGNVSADGTNEYIVRAIDGSPTLVNGKPQGTVFGADIVTAKENAALASKWDMGIPLSALDSEIVGSAYMQCTLTEETLEIGTGTDANASIKVKSIQRVRYEPGVPLYNKFTAAWPKLEDSNGDYTLALGFYDYDNGLLLAQRRRNNALEYGFILVRNAVETWYDLSANFPEGFDPNNLNVYRMDTGYLGIAPTNIYCIDFQREVMHRIHRQVYNQRTTNTLTPDLPIGAIARNEGNTLDVKILNGSVQAGTINGQQESDPSARPFVYRTPVVTIPTSAVNHRIVAFRNPVQVDMYDRIDVSGVPRTRLYTSTIASDLLEIEGVLSGQNKTGSVDLYLIPSTDVTGGTFTEVSIGDSIIEVSLDATFVLTNAKLLDSFPFGAIGNIPNKVLPDLELLYPGFTALFLVNSTSTSFEIRWKIKYLDRF